MSFREFVQNLRPAGLPLGTFLQDAKRDPNLPEANSWDELKVYLIGSNAKNETIQTAFYFWKDYQALRRRPAMPGGLPMGRHCRP